MRQAQIIFRDDAAGVLTQHDDGSFTFRYYDAWMTDSTKSGISLTFPKTHREFHADYLFPFFYNMLPEGSNKQVVCKHHRIDADDYFGLLMVTAATDSIGAVRIIKMENP
ncbi:HipA N-terminal domain-containing protein [Runella sp.]|jgi:serine/threonine-protein kinase HipA|uniref:HipA N-terminal domain-containing protein n=1 Tax=Runella sp. TaxID=1960881 RepID=UPI002635E394|nr:HipA N-terminal domain-containing protein [Runella sp.]